MEQRTVGFIEAVKLAIATNFCKFSGRSSRSEFWWFYLFTALFGFISMFALFLSEFLLVLCGIIYLALILPSLGLSVRRLHDVGRSGWALLINLIPLVGSIIFLVWLLKPSQASENQYGPVPNCN